MSEAKHLDSIAVAFALTRFRFSLFIITLHVCVNCTSMHTVENQHEIETILHVHSVTSCNRGTTIYDPLADCH